MTLPPPPDSFFEGGEPQSQVAPGETGRELLHEVKNLATAVTLLTTVVERQDQRQKQLLTFSLLAILVLAIAVGYSRYLAVQQTQDRLGTARVACEQDRQRGEIEIEILTASLAARPNDPRATAFFQPRIDKLQRLQKNCDALYGPTSPGWPTFFGG